MRDGSAWISVRLQPLGVWVLFELPVAMRARRRWYLARNAAARFKRVQDPQPENLRPLVEAYAREIFAAGTPPEIDEPTQPTVGKKQRVKKWLRRLKKRRRDPRMAL